MSGGGGGGGGEGGGGGGRCQSTIYLVISGDLERLENCAGTGSIHEILSLTINSVLHYKDISAAAIHELTIFFLKLKTIYVVY